ncbi:MAG: hypothetical protein ACR2PR_10360 [Pseudohongiellaceae bacterium]
MATEPTNLTDANTDKPFKRLLVFTDYTTRWAIPVLVILYLFVKEYREYQEIENCTQPTTILEERTDAAELKASTPLSCIFLQCV